MTVDVSDFGTYWKNYDPKTGVGDPSTPVSAPTLNAREAKYAEVLGAAQGFAEAAQEAAEQAVAPTDVTVAELLTTTGTDTNTAARSLLSNSFDKRAISLSRLPVNGSGIISYNGSAHIQDNVTTHNGRQYAVWWGGDLKPYIGVKTLPDGAWSTFDLSTVAGNPLASPVVLDAHNALTVAVDSTGFVHVWGNQHNSPLRYVRSNAAESITSWSAATMIGTNETSMTYPAPVTASDGTLYFWYREGLSGSGDNYLNRYDTTTKTWSRVGKIFDGALSSENAYLNHVAPGPDNSFHLFFTWRGTGYASSNNDFCYAKVFTDGTARRSDGSAQTVPITHANCETIIDTAATGSGIINQQGADVDAQGRPHATTWLYDSAGNTQIQHVWHDGAQWHNDQVTDLTVPIDLNVSVFQPSLSRSQVVCPAQGGTYVIYRCAYNGKGNVLRMIDVTPERPRLEFPICNIDLADWEPTIDTTALKRRNELSMLLIPLAANWQNTTTVPWNNMDNWNNQAVLHTTIDLYQIDAFRSGTVRLPAVETVADRGGPNTGVTITATTIADFTHGPITHASWDDETIFVRYVARVTAGASTTTTLQVRANREAPTGSTLNIATAAATNLTNTYLTTAWVLAPNFASRGDRGFLVLYAFKTGTGTSNVATAKLEIGRLVGLTS